MKIHGLFGRVGVAVLAGVGLSVLSVTAQEMPSRSKTFEALEVAQPVAKLRSTTAPVYRIALSPSKQTILQAAANAKGRSSENSISAVLGHNAEPPVAPYYVGPVLASGMVATNLSWQAVPGGNVTHIVVSSEGAIGVRAMLVLPPGLVFGEIRVAASLNDVAEALPLSLAQNGELWTPYTEGSTQTIEIFTPQKVSAAAIRVERVSHFTESLLTGQKAPGEASVPLAGSCTIDVVCTTNNAALDEAMATASNSVAKVAFVAPIINGQPQQGNFICSGTLLNSNAFPAPFFLTANHCISTQAEAASVATIWFRKNSVCGANVPNENFPSTVFPGQVTVSGGAQLVFTNQMTDGTLLRLNQSPPNGVVYSGWNQALLAKNDAIVSISHPGGAPMKWAQGTVLVIKADGTPDPNPAYADGLIGLQGYNQQFYATFLTQGIIEGGSSGSGLFTLSNGNLQLRGILSSSTVRNATTGLSCTNLNENTNYGRFEIFYEQIKYYLNGQTPPASDDYPNQPSASGPILPLNATLNATLDYIGDLDVFRIVVPRAGKLSVGSHGTDASGAFLDTMAILLQSDGSCMPDPAGKGECNNNATNDDAPNTSPRDTNFLIKDIDVQAGTYYVSVGMWDPQATTPNGYQIYSIFAATLTPQTITFANPGSRALSSGTVAANAVATSGLAVTLSSITPSVCNIAGANIVFTAAGVCTVAADQAGDANFGVATQVKQSFFVYPAQALAKRGAIDIDGNNKSVLIVRSAGGQMLAGRFSSNLPGAGQFTFTSLADPGAAFRLVGAVDFDGNGKTDLAFQNPTLLDVEGKSNVLAWNDFAPANERVIRLVKPAWVVQAVGDLDGDGLGDMVLRWTGFTADRPDDTGVSYIWFATGVNGAGDPVVRKRGGAPLSWTLLGAADLNGDGAADMIYISPDGAIRALMATPGRTCANFSAGTMPVGYSALKLADFTGQRRGDILIRNASGATSLLSLNAVGLVLPPFVGDPTNINASCTASSQIIASTAINLPATDPSWQFYASGDFDGDGIFDMVWLRPDGTLTVWLMGNNGVVLNVISNAGTAPAGYTVFQP